MELTRRCDHCGKAYSTTTSYLNKRAAAGQTSFYCGLSCAAKARSRAGVPQRSNRRRAANKRPFSKRRRVNVQRTNEDRRWARQVVARDKQCQRCGATTQLQAHHLKPYATNPALRLSLDNGITLCASCHADVHPGVPRYLFFRNYRRKAKR